MAELKRSVKCMNCGSEKTLYVSSDMQISDLLFHGKCLQCNSSIQVNFSLVGDQPSSPPTGGSETSDSGMVNLDDTLFEPDLPTNALKDLIEE